MPRKKNIATEQKQKDNNDIFILYDKKNTDTLNEYLNEIKIKNMNLEELNKTGECITKFRDVATQSIQYLMDTTDKMIALTNEITKEIELKKDKHRKNYTNLQDLILNIKNFEQIKRLHKILPDNQDYAKVYLQGYTKNTDVKKENLLGTIKILGQYNFQKKERESYNIKLFQNENHSFWCSCIDHKLNSAKKNTVCKHISFIVCKVMKILEPEFFESKKITDKQMEMLISKFSDKSELWKNKDLVRDIQEITINYFKDFKGPIDDVCTFCYDDMSDKDKDTSVYCPTCNHCYHTECMNIWLENYERCSVCSSEVWKHYITIKNGGTVVANNKL